MADSFFGFNTSLNEGLELVEEPELDEEEYDALNDETFGADAFQGDWEEDHTRFAKVAENSRTYTNSYNSEKDDDLDLEASISQLVLEGEEDEDEEFDAVRHKTTKTNNIPDRLVFDYIGGNSSSAWSNSNEKTPRLLNRAQLSQLQKSQSIHSSLAMPSTNILPPQLPRIPTVQELERDIMQKNKQSQYVDKENKLNDISHTIMQDKKDYLGVVNSSTIQNCNNQFQSSNAQQQNAHGKLSHPLGSKVPPGFGPPQQSPFSQLQQPELVMLRNNQNMPMQLGPLLLPPHLPMLLSPHILPPPPPPHPFMMGQNHRVSPHPMMRFMPNHPLLMQQQQQQQQLQQQKQQLLLKHANKIQNNQDNLRNGQTSRSQHIAGHSQHPWLYNPNRRGNGNYDEYAGLMNNKERQWLLNIQIIQLATDKPHVDDYYYMVWSKKQEKEKKLKEESRNGLKTEKQNREPFFANNRQPRNESVHRERRDSEREVTVTPSPRVYVPLQFENSLGKLQCGSVTAPRKIIDLDVVPERQIEAAPSGSHRDCRKTKKILLELEQLYLLAMDVEALDNNLALEGNPPTEEPPLSKPKLLEQIMTSCLNEERFVNFMCIRKGKTLLLRVLPHLNHSDHFEHLTNLWCRLIKSVSIIIRRDHNDGILLQMYPYFKSWINTVDCTVLLLIASYLLTANIPNSSKKSSRAVSPNSGKSVLSYILTTTFGVSIVSSILSRGETIFPTLEEKEKLDWTNIVLNFIKHMTNSPNLENVSSGLFPGVLPNICGDLQLQMLNLANPSSRQIPTPLDPLPANVLTVILNRSTGLHIQDYASAKRVLTAFNKDKSRS